MRKILFAILLAMVLPLVGFAQLPSSGIFEKYKNKEGFEITAIPSFLIKSFAESMTSSLKDDEKELVTKCIKSVSSLSFITANSSTSGVNNFLTEAGKLSNNSKYTELISVKQGTSSMKIVSHKNGSTITEILGFGGDESQKVLFSVQGNFTEALIKEVVAKAQKYNKH